MSAKAAAAAPAAPDAPKPKSKGKLIIILAVVLLLAGGGGGAWFFLNKKKHDAATEEVAEAPEKSSHAAPTYMPLENMVVNLADAGGDRFAQVGITLDLENDKTAEKIKAVLPVVRSRILMLVSQRTSDELLKRDGKEKLADDIVAEVSLALGYEVDDPAPKKKKAKASEGEDEEDAPKPKKKKRKAAATPVNGVLFSAFIIQ